MTTSSIIVDVRFTRGAYHATAFGVHVSSEISAHTAVERLGKKLFGQLQRINAVEQIQDNATGFQRSQWEIEIDTTQACRVCGCTYTNPCGPHSCHWVEPDLCSVCANQALEVA